MQREAGSFGGGNNSELNQETNQIVLLHEAVLGGTDLDTIQVLGLRDMQMLHHNTYFANMAMNLSIL
jgi:hypothetical protein